MSSKSPDKELKEQSFEFIELTLITDPLPGNEKRWGCIGTLMAIIGIILLSVFVFLLATGAAVLAF